MDQRAERLGRCEGEVADHVREALPCEEHLEVGHDVRTSRFLLQSHTQAWYHTLRRSMGSVHATSLYTVSFLYIAMCSA